MASGKFLWKFKVRNYGVMCLLAEPLGLVAVDLKTFLVSDSEKACVHIYDEEGRYNGKFGDTEMRTKQPAGQCDCLYGISAYTCMPFPYIACIHTHRKTTYAIPFYPGICMYIHIVHAAQCFPYIQMNRAQHPVG